MPMLEKMLIVSGLARNAYGKWQMERLLSGAIAVAGLTIVTGIMISAMLIGGIYAAYHSLLNLGIDTSMTLLLISALLLVTTGLLVLATRNRMRPLVRRSPTRDALNAFMDGLLTEQPQRR